MTKVLKSLIIMVVTLAATASATGARPSEPELARSLVGSTRRLRVAA